MYYKLSGLKQQKFIFLQSEIKVSAGICSKTKQNPFLSPPSFWRSFVSSYIHSISASIIMWYFPVSLSSHNVFLLL